MSNKKKSQQLGMNYGTASHRLRKMIMFSLIQQTHRDICHQCGEKIEEIDDLSIEHKIKWQDSEGPQRLFFDLENIAFSHLKCNIRDSRPGRKRIGVSNERYIHYDKSPRLLNKWSVKVPTEKGRVSVGRFQTLESAIAARDKYLMKG